MTKSWYSWLTSFYDFWQFQKSHFVIRLLYGGIDLWLRVYLGGVRSHWGEFGDKDSSQNDPIGCILYKKSKFSSAMWCKLDKCQN